MKITTRFIFSVFCTLLLTGISGCSNQGRYIKGPDGKMYYELPESRNTEDHCRVASRFSRRIAESRSHPETRDGQTITVPHDPKSSRADFEKDLKDVERFTEVGKRNYDKILELLGRILDTGEFKDKSPESVESTIYGECMEQMKNGTWFKKTLRI